MEYNKREWQLFEVSILDKVVAICEKHNIRYYLSSGTLLGAVRHKGFIPWDDDIDIDMPMKDYRKFCKVAPKELELVGCFLQTYKTDPEASLSWAMVRANNTTSLPVSSYKWNIHWGVHVDIFPLIGLYKNKSLRSLQYKLFGLSRTLLEKDYIYACCPDYRMSLKVKALYKLPRFVRHGLVGLFDIFIDRDFFNAEEGTVKWSNLTTKYDPRFYESKTVLEFEGRQYAVPANYNGQLTLLYGDYMTPPPETEREGHELIQGNTIRDLKRDYRLYQRELIARRRK